MTNFLKYSPFLCFIFLATPGSAASIAITNASFESDVLNCAAGTPGCSTNDTITGWTGTAPSGTVFGVYKPGAASYPLGVPNGVNVAFLTEDGPSVSISQTLSATVQASDTYTLNYYVGLRADPTVFNPAFGCYGFSVSLEAGGMVLATANPSCPATTGTFESLNLVYNSGANPAQLGDPLEIVLTATGSGSPFEPAEIDFDNLSLSDASGSGNSAPEPASGLIVMVGLGLFGIASRHKARRA
jgi:hypothetical protein